MYKKRHEHADFMLNIDISFLRNVVYKDYPIAKKFVTTYVAYAFSEHITKHGHTPFIHKHLVDSIAMDSVSLNCLFKEFCYHNSSQEIFQYRFQDLMLYPDFMDFISYTSLHLEEFICKLIDRVAINHTFYQDKIVIVSPVMVSVNLLSITTKVVEIYDPAR